MSTSEPAAAGRPRRRLNPEMIVECALRLVRAEGPAAVTMRRLAEELGTAPMSLYRHIRDRETLLVAMLDEVAEGIELPEPVGDPRAEVTAVFTALHDALRRDPWAVPLIVTDKLAGPSIMAALERVFAALHQAGLAPRDAMVAYALLWHYTAGELLDAHLDDTAASFAHRMVRAADPAFHPALARTMAAFPPGPSGDWYTENLQRLLDGLLRPYPAAGSGPPGP
ncbi:TetR/AcrR family transcriptional regulator [Planomonospora algeriensis]